jgi:hypothetical protein
VTNPEEPTARLLEHYREAAERTGDTESAAAMDASLEVHALYKRLRESPEGRAGIDGLTLDPNPQVRRWAATHMLMWNRGRGRATLKELAQEQ